MYLHLVVSMSCMYKGPRIVVSPRASKKSGPALVVEPPNLMPPRSTCLPLGIKYSREDTKLRSSVEHTTRESPKKHIFHQDHK